MLRWSPGTQGPADGLSIIGPPFGSSESPEPRGSPVQIYAIRRPKLCFGSDVCMQPVRGDKTYHKANNAACTRICPSRIGQNA